MSSYDKNINKNKYLFKQGNNFLSYMNNNPSNLLSNIVNFKKENIINFPEINGKINKLNPVIQTKQSNDFQRLNNITEISKTSLSKPKNENDLNNYKNSKFKLSKIVSKELSTKINTSRILDTYSNTKNTTKNSQMNSIKIEVNTPTDNNNLIVMKKSKAFNTSNSINDLRDLTKNKKLIENTNSNSDSYCNNILNENSTNNSNLITKRETIGHSHIKTDINDTHFNTPNNNNIKLVLPNKNTFGKKLNVNIQNKDIFGTPYGLLRKNNPILLPHTTPENKLKCSLDKNNQNNQQVENNLKKINNINNNKILTIKPTKNEHIILESIDNSNVKDTKTLKTKFTLDSIETNIDCNKQIKKNKICKCPEELHFYFITVLQEGKKSENDFEVE